MRTRATLTLGMLALAACGQGGAQGDSMAATTDARTPRQIVFAYDRSTSITPEELRLYHQLSTQTLQYLDHGDRVAAIEILQLSLDEIPRRWSQHVPEREFANRVMQRDSVSRARFLQDARDYLTNYVDPEDRDNFLGTDILGTLHDIAEDIRGFPNHRSTVILFSDMLQATQEMNMEGMMRMPPADWVSRRAAEGRLPDFGGACIVVAGARTDTTEGQRVKAFWEEYFEATGATLLDRNYAYRPIRIPEDPCG